MRTRLTLMLLALLTGTCAGLAAGDVAIKRLWTGYRDAEGSVRIAEYFGGTEATRGTIFLRSRPEAREGLYYTIRLDAGRGQSLGEGRVVLRVIAPDAAVARVYEFPFTTEGRRSVCLQVGLTGEDWLYGRKLPLAWQLEIQDAAGQPQVTRQSFLWEKPAR